MKIAIIGGGAAGLSAGYYLSKAGARIELFERDSTLGGLAGSFFLSGGYVEKFYHFICLNDSVYIDTLRDLGVSDRLRWRYTEMGQFYQGSLYSFGRPLDLLRFPALSWSDRIRFALKIMTIKSAPWEDWKKLEHVPVDEWLQNTFGEAVYKSLHEPMIRLKFGKYKEKLAASWMWARIHRLGRSRTRIRQREKVGYVEGGSQTIMDALGDEIRTMGGSIHLNASVEKLIIDRESIRGLMINGKERIFDAVLSTVPLPAFLKLLPDSLEGEYWNKLRNIESIGVLCVFLRTTKSFSKFFWTNISDPRIQLAGVIEYTNLNPLKHLGGDSILYLPQYLPSSVDKFSMPNEQIISEYLGYLKIINPSFDEQYVKEAFVFREKYAQPICEVGFTKDIPSMKTPLDGLYLTDSSQLHPDDRTISNSIGLGKQAAKIIAAHGAKVMKGALVAVLILVLFVSSSSAENWPQWRGIRMNGTSVETGLPVQWSASQNVVWRLPLPGPAASTPVVWNDRIFLTSTAGQDLVLLSVGTNGKTNWQRKVATGNKNVKEDEANLAAPSPSTDGKHVWAFFGSGDLVCYDWNGKEIWKTNLQERYGKFNLYFVMSTSPLLDGNRLYLHLIHSDASIVLALDKATGREIWKHQRVTDARDECEHSYASPIVYRDGKQEFLLVHGADYITAHALNDGKEIWRAGGLNPKERYNPAFRFVASPVAAPGLIVVPSAKNGPVLGLKPNGQGNVTDIKQYYAWKLFSGTPDVPSPLIQDGLVYLCRENGDLSAIDAQTGRRLYLEHTHQSRHRASPVYGDGKLYVTSHDGVVTVVKAGRQFQMLSQNRIDEPISASPVISNGRIYLRTYNALYAIGSK